MNAIRPDCDKVVTPINAISKIILDSDYTGWIIVEAEQDPVAANPLEYALLSKKYLENIWSA